VNCELISKLKMSIKPAAVSSVLPQVLREPGNRPPGTNRFAPLADRGRSASVSGHSPAPAVKRPHPGGGAPAGKSTKLDDRVFFVMESAEKMIAKGRHDLDKARSALLKDKDLSPTVKEILGGLIAGFEHMTDAVETVASVLVDSAKKGNGSLFNGGPPTDGKNNGRKPVQESDPAKVKKDKFCAEVRDAEKSLLVFQLDLGKVPIMNTATMAKNVTSDVVRKAAKVENSANGRPSDDTIATLDDTLSVATGMDFFGKVTKPYVNKKNEKDPANATFHTLPVKINFATKEAKQRAETIFRKRCKIQCATPYPKRLRTAIGELVSGEKSKFPGCFIQVKVDLESMSLKVSRRSDEGWTNNYHSVQISDKVIDTNQVANSVPMETDSGNRAL
jgi:hypothetical protein